MIAVHAPAKINLYLHVVGQRDDGYHLLDSLIVFAGIGDEISAHESDDLEFSIAGPFAHALINEADNLVVRAAHALADAAGVPAAANIRLTKNLPVAAGIGGGSADAAAALIALQQLWRIDLPPGEITGIARALGADVPVCLASTPSFVGGVGEFITDAPDLPDAWLVLANPRVPVATPDVFAAHGSDWSKSGRFLNSPESAAELAALLSERRNDLTKAATGIAPEIAATIAALGDTPGALLARMSGSGATCFALFAGEDEARRAEAELRERYPGWWVAAAPIISGR